MSRDIEIVVQAQLGGFTVALTATAALDPADIDSHLDLMGKRIDRQRAVEQLPEALVDLVAAKKALETLPDREREAIREIEMGKVRLREKWEADYELSNRRGAFHLTAAQRQGLVREDERIAQKREEFAKEKASHEAAIPAFEEKIKRLRARIEGGDKTAPLEAELLEAAE